MRPAPVTCCVRYEIDSAKIAEFETFARLWIRLVTRFGGQHHGYFLPSEGASDVALALFTFPSLAAYEAYRTASMSDPECLATNTLADKQGLIRRHERSFFRPFEKSLTVDG